MEHNQPFIGTGPNPEGPDLPLGLGMLLAQEPAAIDNFGKLDVAGKEAVVRYVQSGATGEDAQNRIAEAVVRLREGDTGFFGPR
ncbi:hypothetical protein ACH6CV_06850 [Bacillota bacterium Meth-B3]|nr:YdeI/OmpD-associated family protein [Christensenellaceae bacterium]MEA5065107.1 YdeI/OmpD-associated family protein [Eubacteriales bacterium]MEA5067756.1 YdeI/OmpD-associated family protein [Christensenellaceae bacterium]